MSFWIEVTTGMRWKNMGIGAIGLRAPDTTRYRKFFNKLKKSDLVFHYLITHLTPRMNRSKIIGLSVVSSNPKVIGKSIRASCSNTIEFSKPIPYRELLQIDDKSSEFAKLTGCCMQKYLTKISKHDFKSIIEIYQDNKKQFLKSDLFKYYEKIKREKNEF